MVSNIHAALLPLAAPQQAQRHVPEWTTPRLRPLTSPVLGRGGVYSVRVSGGPRVQAARAELAQNLPAVFPDAPADLLQHIHALWAMQLADSLVVSVTKTFSKFVSFCLQDGFTALPALCTAAVRCQKGGRHDVVKLPLPPGVVVGSIRQAAACHDVFELRLHVFVCLKFLSGVRGHNY